MVAGGTYDNEFFFENVLNKFGGLFTGRVITNDFTLDNKQMISITVGGIANNNKLTTQGYVDSKAQDLRDYVDNHYFTKPEINVKIDGINDVIDGLTDNIEAVADSVTALSATVALCATSTAMAIALATKADKSDVYDKDDIDDMMEEKADVSSVYTKSQVNNMVNGKANAADVYTKTEVNNLVSGKANASDVYTKNEVNGFLLLKANISDVYTKNEIDAALILKANVADVYTKTETNNLLTLKADTSDVYTKTQVYTKTEVDTALNLKADKATTYTKTEVDAMIGGVVPTTDSVGKKYPGSTGGEIFNDYTNNEASGNYSHAEGYNAVATGNYSHAEGWYTNATGNYSHAEGTSSATGEGSHAEGISSIATGRASHAGGEGTYADQTTQTAIGTFNTPHNSNCLFVVGNGTSDQVRCDAFAVYNNGQLKVNNNYNLYFGNIYFGWSPNSDYPSNSIQEVSAVGWAIIYKVHTNTVININVPNVKTYLTGSQSVNPLFLVYVRLEGDNRLYGNTFPEFGYNPGPCLHYYSNTNPLLLSLESEPSHPSSSKLISHWNNTSYGSGFIATCNFNFINTQFVDFGVL